MEEVLVPETPPQPVRAVAVMIPQPNLSETFLREANRRYPLSPQAAHLKRIRRLPPGDSPQPQPQLQLLLCLCAEEGAQERTEESAQASTKERAEERAQERTEEGTEERAQGSTKERAGERAEERAQERTEERAEERAGESAGDAAGLLARAERRIVSVADRPPRVSAPAWDAWNAAWPLAVPRPRPPLPPPPPPETDRVRRALAETVLPLARRVRGGAALGIAAAVIDAAGNVIATSDAAAPMRRGDAAARGAYGAPAHEGSSTGEGGEGDKISEDTQQCVIEHPVTYVLKELGRKQSNRRIRESVPSNNSEDDTNIPYLANGLDIVVSHEPCVMCAMALVHSRIRRAYYCFPNYAYGGLGSVFSIHAVPSLNHHFRAFRCTVDDEWNDLITP